MRRQLFGGFVILLSACGGMRNVERNGTGLHAKTDSTAHLEFDQALKQEKSLEQLTLMTDSMNSSYSVEIWPTGPFRYNAAKGFEGTAEKIRIKGTWKQGQQVLGKSNLKEIKDAHVSTRLDTEEHTNIVVKNSAVKKVVSWKTVLGYVLIAFSLIVALLIFRSIRKTFSFF